MPTGIYTRTIKTRKILSDAAKRRVERGGSWWTGKKHTKETKLKIGLSKLGKKQLPETIAKRIPKLRGRIFTEEHRRKISEAQKGEKGNNWKGGLESKNKTVHHSVDYKLWREAVFKRDNWTCQKCKTRGKRGKRVSLHPHHIFGFAHYPQQRFTISNGITLCVDCHRTFHKNFGERENHHINFYQWL